MAQRKIDCGACGFDEAIEQQQQQQNWYVEVFLCTKIKCISSIYQNKLG